MVHFRLEVLQVNLDGISSMLTVPNLEQPTMETCRVSLDIGYLRDQRCVREVLQVPSSDLMVSRSMRLEAGALINRQELIIVKEESDMNGKSCIICGFCGLC